MNKTLQNDINSVRFSELLKLFSEVSECSMKVTYKAVPQTDVHLFSLFILHQNTSIIIISLDNTNIHFARHFIADPPSAPLIPLGLPGLSRVINSLLTYLLT